MEQATHLIIVMYYAMHSHTQAQVHVCTYTLHTTTKYMLCVCDQRSPEVMWKKGGNSQPLPYLSELLVDENGRVVGRRRKVAVGCWPTMVWGEMLLVR